ncbi:MAG: Gfo/Idh/MocA family oxidoreductase [Clostridiales bacterium]|nr:Gfo/Idh/MocA family oxidoreductase [Clostridiales bacterium]
MKKLRFGVIGAGGIADRRTLPGMMLANNVEVVAVMEIDAELSEKLRKKYNAKYAYTNAEDLVKNPEVDAVYIASPVVFHCKQAMLAADNGKHILIEKPISMDIEEGEKLLQYCENKGVKVAAGFMMRFGAHVMNMKKAVEEGKIGQIVSGYSQFTLWLPQDAGNWRLVKSKSGGGSLMDMGVHCIDLIEYITGSRVVEVGAFNDTVVFGYDVEDSSTVILKLENGAQCVVQTNFNIPDEIAKWRLEFFGTKGRLMGDTIIGQVDGGRLNAAYVEENVGYSATQNHSEIKGEELKGEFGNMYTREVESFADSILNDKPLVVPASDALHVQKVIAAAYKSTEERKLIKL